MDETSDACALCKQKFGSQDEELQGLVPFWQGLDYLILPLQKGVGFHFKFHSSKRDSESSRIIYESVLCYSILQHNISYHSYVSYGRHTYSTFIFLYLIQTVLTYDIQTVLTYDILTVHTYIHTYYILKTFWWGGHTLRLTDCTWRNYMIEVDSMVIVQITTNPGMTGMC